MAKCRTNAANEMIKEERIKKKIQKKREAIGKRKERKISAHILEVLRAPNSEKTIEGMKQRRKRSVKEEEKNRTKQQHTESDDNTSDHHRKRNGSPAHKPAAKEEKCAGNVNTYNILCFESVQI